MNLAPPRTVLDEITDFLATRPTAEALLAYRLPDELNQRAAELMELNRQNRLSADERAEMSHLCRPSI